MEYKDVFEFIEQNKELVEGFLDYLNRKDINVWMAAVAEEAEGVEKPVEKKAAPKRKRAYSPRNVEERDAVYKGVHVPSSWIEPLEDYYAGQCDGKETAEKLGIDHPTFTSTRYAWGLPKLSREIANAYIVKGQREARVKKAEETTSENSTPIKNAALTPFQVAVSANLLEPEGDVYKVVCEEKGFCERWCVALSNHNYGKTNGDRVKMPGKSFLGDMLVDANGKRYPEYRLNGIWGEKTVHQFGL